MISPFDCYVQYLAIKRHFLGTYDYFKYNGKIKANVKSFQTRNDRFFFEKLSKHRDPKNFLIVNLMDNPKAWIRELVYSEECEAKFLDWERKMSSITYIFTSDLAKMDDDLADNLQIIDKTHPKILKLFLSGKINIETMIILFDLLKYYEYIDDTLGDDITWRSVKEKMLRYKPFFNYDVGKFKQIIRDKFY